MVGCEAGKGWQVATVPVPFRGTTGHVAAVPPWPGWGGRTGPVEEGRKVATPHGMFRAATTGLWTRKRPRLAAGLARCQTANNVSRASSRGFSVYSLIRFADTCASLMYAQSFSLSRCSTVGSEPGHSPR